MAGIKLKCSRLREAILETVNAVYGCALSSDHWPETLRLIGQLCESPALMLVLHDCDEGRTKLIASTGYAVPFTRVYEEDYAIQSPLLTRTLTQPIGAVRTRSMLIDDCEFYGCRHYLEWLKPQGFDDAVTCKVLQTPGRVTSWIAHRHEDSPRFGDSEVRMLTNLAQAICRAMKIGQALNNQTLLLNALESSVDVLATGVYLIGHNGRIDYMNPAAERQVKTGRGLRTESGRLIPVDCAARVAFDRAISETTQAGVTTLAIPDGSRVGLIATILPMRREEWWHACNSSSPVATIFVQDPVVAVTLPGEAFARLHRLTDCERRVALALASGSCIKDAAHVLGVSETTVKTHLSHIFSKTGTSKQSELLRLLTNCVPPLNLRGTLESRSWARR